MRDIEVVALLRLLACLLTLGRSVARAVGDSALLERNPGGLRATTRASPFRLLGSWDVLRGWDLSEVHCRIPGQAHLSSDEDMYMELLTYDVVRYSGTQHHTRAHSPPLLSAIEHVH